MVEREIIERLEKAIGPSLDLDGRVWCAVNGLEYVMWDGAGCVYKDPAAPKWDRGIKHAPASLIKPYTASLDAAVALVERMLPGCRWELTTTGFKSGATINDRNRGIHGAYAATPAIALLIALLRALKEGAAET